MSMNSVSLCRTFISTYDSWRDCSSKFGTPKNLPLLYWELFILKMANCHKVRTDLCHSRNHRGCIKTLAGEAPVQGCSMDGGGATGCCPCRCLSPHGRLAGEGVDWCGRHAYQSLGQTLSIMSDNRIRIPKAFSRSKSNLSQKVRSWFLMYESLNQKH